MRRTQDSYLFDPALNGERMVFLSGPRQVGKTTLVQDKLRALNLDDLYFNWDDPQVRRTYEENPHFLKSRVATASGEKPLVAFDEIHKHRQWKNILKGLYDIHRDEARFIVTGSARLDFFRQSGDSLVGRYFAYRMLPLGLSEAAQNFSHDLKNEAPLAEPDKYNFLALAGAVEAGLFQDAFRQWLQFGGFPEPFLKQRESFSLKWRRDYRSLLVREDLRDLTRIQDVKGVEQMALLLPGRIGAPLSVNALREDLKVNHKTADLWLEAFVKLYLIFSVQPWAKKLVRAISKERKCYFFDWTMAESPGARLENAVAVALLRAVSRWNELGAGEFDLCYVRNQQGHEVDFLLVRNGKPMALLEAKTGDAAIGKSGNYFSNLLQVPYFQIVAEGDILTAYPDRRYVVSAWRLLPMLG